MGESPRRFELRLAPWEDADGWSGIDVTYDVDLPRIPAGDVLLLLPRVAASIPGAAYATADLEVSDARGPLALQESAGESNPMMAMRQWSADRDTHGPLHLHVKAPVRVIDVRTPVGPLFDLRREHQGLFGAGMTFIPVPAAERAGECAFTLQWTLPEGATAVTSHGRGPHVEWTGDVQSVQFCLYGAGRPTIEPADPETFAIHAYSDVPFDLPTLGDYVGRIHRAFCEFFEETHPEYNVLVRRNPDKGSGGTAFPSSFAFGYSPTTPVDEEDLRTLLAHEMVHNWPRISGEWTESAWYTEGTAEFYSLVLPWRAGLVSDADLAAKLNRRFSTYDTNPQRVLSAQDAAALTWADLRVQRIPYGRGLRYLMQIDGELRAATAGRICLDDIVLDILRTQRLGQEVDVDGWLERIGAHLGPQVREEWEAMMAGAPLPFPSHPFQDAFTATAVMAPEQQLGFDVASFNHEPRLIGGLVSGGPADRAGLRDGDELLTRRFTSRDSADGSSPVTLEFRRDGQDRSVTFEPRGDDVPTVCWSPRPLAERP